MPEPQPRGSLEAWLRRLLLGAVLVPLAAFVAVAWWGLQLAQQEAEDRADRAVATAHEHARRALGIAIDVAELAARLTAGPDAEVRTQEAALRQRMDDMLTGLPSILNMNVWDASGTPLVRSDRAVDPRATVRDRAYFQAHRDPGVRMGLSEVLTGRQTGLELMNLTVRRPSADGSFRGIVAVSMTPDYFRQYFRTLVADDKLSGSFALMRRDGTVLAQWPSPAEGGLDLGAGSPTLDRVLRGAPGGSHLAPASTSRGAQVVSFRAVQGQPAYVVAGFERAEMMRDWMRFLGVLAAVIGPIAAVLVYVTWVALKKTRQEAAMADDLREEIGKRSAAEHAALEAQKLETLSVLTGGIAHDFNNLLAILDTSLHLHRRKHPELQDDPQVGAMTRAVRSGVRLTRQLLSFSRKQALKPETVQLQTWLPAIDELLKTTLGGRVDLRLQVDSGTHPISVDTAELELALINLALNAKHAMPHGGELRVFAHDTRDAQDGARSWVTISVVDTGVGIPPHLIARVVEPFFTTRQRGAGSGLGLSQVHGFCSQSGGRLVIECPPEGGTAVHMHFPAQAVRTRARAAGDAATPVSPSGARRLSGTLLLVEDNTELARSSRAYLAAVGLDVIWASSGDLALMKLASLDRPPDVVLSDIEMPGRLSGIDLAFKLRTERPGLPVLLTTGYADQIDQAIAGGFEVVPKPVDVDRLLDRLAELIAPPPVEARPA